MSKVIYSKDRMVFKLSIYNGIGSYIIKNGDVALMLM